MHTGLKAQCVCEQSPVCVSKVQCVCVKCENAARFLKGVLSVLGVRAVNGVRGVKGEVLYT